MTFGLTPLQRQQKRLPPQPEEIKSKDHLLPAETNQEACQPFLAFVVPKEIDDPSHWDEAWFANYE